VLMVWLVDAAARRPAVRVAAAKVGAWLQVGSGLGWAQRPRGRDTVHASIKLWREPKRRRTRRRRRRWW
jgi:hypothetical protein